LKHFDVTILCCPQIANDPIVSVAVEYFTANKPSKQQTVILISSLLTWFKSALTDAESGLTEEDYRKRKSHPNYKWLLELERKVLKLTPPAQNEDDQSESSVNVTAGSYKAFVVSTGLVYHPYDGLFHEFLRQAWLGNDSDCFGTGDNVVPMIHLIDLASIAVRTVQILPETRYIVAVDDGKSPLSAVLKVFSLFKYLISVRTDSV
jgi:adenylate kinase